MFNQLFAKGKVNIGEWSPRWSRGGYSTIFTDIQCKGQMHPQWPWHFVFALYSLPRVVVHCMIIIIIIIIIIITSYKEPLNQSDCRKHFVQLWNYTKTNNQLSNSKYKAWALFCSEASFFSMGFCCRQFCIAFQNKLKLFEKHAETLCQLLKTFTGNPNSAWDFSVQDFFYREQRKRLLGYCNI